jgi:hypothetical protein
MDEKRLKENIQTLVETNVLNMRSCLVVISLNADAVITDIDIDRLKVFKRKKFSTTVDNSQSIVEFKSST